MERRATMSPQELAACRRAFEKLDASGYKDLAYDSNLRRYSDLFTQGRWVNWQNAWREGQRYLKEGDTSARQQPVQQQPTPAPTRRITRVSRS